MYTITMMMRNPITKELERSREAFDLPAGMQPADLPAKLAEIGPAMLHCYSLRVTLNDTEIASWRNPDPYA